MTSAGPRAAALLLAGLAAACDGAPVLGGATPDGGASPDAARDAAPDASPDAAPDASPDAARDATPDVGLRSGLVETGRGAIDLRTGASPHLGRLLVHGATAYVANSFDGVAAFTLGPAGRVALAREERMGGSVPRCTTIALHAPSATLFCAAADRTGPALGETTSPVAAYAVGGADAFALRTPAAARVGFHVAALHVQGDRLVLAAFDRGLFHAAVARDGVLGPVAALPGSGDAVAVAGDGGLLAQLDRDAGLRLWRSTAGGFEPLGSPAALDGPALAVSVEGSTVAVALGSRGAAVYEASASGPSLRARLRPPCAAVAVALHGDLAAAVCMDGLHLYAWRDDPAHLRGYVPTETASLDAAFAGDALVASDWSAVAAYRVDRGGEALCPMLPRGRYVLPDQDVTVPVANPGAVPLHVELAVDGAGALGPVDLAPGASAEVRVPASRVRRTDERSYLRASAREAGGSVGARTALRVVAVGDAAPAIGSAFPPLEADEGGAALPLAGREQLVVFNNDTCVALWPELQDLAWLARRGMLPGGLDVRLVTNRNPEFVAAWRLQDLATLVRSDSYTLYERAYRVDGIPGPWHTEYFVDARGVVREAARVYAGPASPVGGFPR